MRTLLATLLAPVLWSPALAAPDVEPAELAPQRAEEQFEHCGYGVSAAAALSDHPVTLLPRFTPVEPAEDVAVFVVRDPGETGREDGRSLTVLVFPDAARAMAAFDAGVRLATLADRLQGVSPATGPAAVAVFLSGIGPRIANSRLVSRYPLLGSTSRILISICWPSISRPSAL